MPEVLMDCPFCKAVKTVKVFQTPSYVGFHTSRGSGQSNTYQVGHREKYDVVSGCSACGKKRLEIKKKMGF